MLALELVNFVLEYRAQHPLACKEAIATATAHHFNLTCKRSVFSSAEVAVRFSTAAGNGFSNTVLSLSALQAYDRVPFVVCLVRPTSTEFFLANSTFLKKISHSSQALRVNNLRGSFNGSDILRDYEGILNCPDNIEQLFATHLEFTWDQNIERLVEATNAIAGTGRRFAPTVAQRSNLLAAPVIAQEVIHTREYLQLLQEIDTVIQEKAPEILRLAAVNNVNLRGNQIEQLITGHGNAHAVADMRRNLSSGVEIQIEIKTKLLDKSSAPKAYNIDKVLETLSVGRMTIAYCFVGVDVRNGRVLTRTVSIFDRSILDATRIQFHWAGRNSRGVTQLTGDFARVFDPNFREEIDVPTAQAFLEMLQNL